MKHGNSKYQTGLKCKQHKINILKGKKVNVKINCIKLKEKNPFKMKTRILFFGFSLKIGKSDTDTCETNRFHRF